METGGDDHGNRSACFRWTVAGTLAPAPQLGLAWSCPSRKRTRTRSVYAGVSGEPVRRGEAAGLEPGIPAAWIPLLSVGRVSNQGEALPASLWRFARGEGVRRDSGADHASRGWKILDSR